MNDNTRFEKDEIVQLGTRNGTENKKLFLKRLITKG